MVNEKIKLYNEYKNKLNSLSYALFISSFDSDTDGPIKSREENYKMRNYLNKLILDITTNNKFIELNEFIVSKKEEVDPVLVKDCEKFLKKIRKILNIPQEEYLEHISNLMYSSNAWEMSRKINNYDEFIPYFVKNIEYMKKYVRYQDKTVNIYDYLLDEYEEGFTVEKYDFFFDLIKKEIVPLVKEINSKKKIDYRINGFFSKDKQRLISDYFIKVLNYDLEKGCIRETVHPFSSGIFNKDCRITVSYDTKDFTKSIYSLLHECGHAIYNMNNCDDLNFTNLFGGASMGLHESQSRLYENYFGRNYSFLKKNFDFIKNIFNEELKDIDFEYFYKSCNNVKNDYIRIDADELTYPIHILIRYEVEKELFVNNLDPLEAPKLWAKLTKEYLGLDYIDDSLGIFQDIHYAHANFGYFPTYALGSAYAAQIYNTIEKFYDLDKLLENNDFVTINKFLKDKIHRFGGLLNNKEVILICTKEEFNPSYYVNYLKNKFKKLYLN